MTEAEVLGLLRRHYLGANAEPAMYDPSRGNGGEWAFVSHVRNASGFDGARTIDAMAWGMWQSRGLSIHAHEVKCSRRDWLTEKRNPAKADAFHELCDFFWLVVAHESIVQPGELPELWGLMVVKGGRIHVVKEAPHLRAPARGRRARDALPPAMGRSAVAALLRAAVRSKAEERREEQEIREAGYAEGVARGEAQVERARAGEAAANAQFELLERLAGRPLTVGWVRDGEIERIGLALRQVLAEEQTAERAVRQVLGQARRLRELADEMEQVLAGESEEAVGV